MFGFTIVSKERLKNMEEFGKIAYNLGYKAGKREAMMSKFTPNEIRKSLGLDPVSTVSRDGDSV